MPLAQGARNSKGYAIPDVERYICLECFFELNEYVVICLNAMSKPDDYQEVQEEGHNWQWDRETLTRPQGMVTSLQNRAVVSVRSIIPVIISSQ